MKTNLSATEIIDILKATKLDGYSRKQYVLKHATNKHLVEALSIADTALQRQAICQVLGTKKAKIAVCLSHSIAGTATTMAKPRTQS